jgi:hypothetical protein
MSQTVDVPACLAEALAWDRLPPSTQGHFGTAAQYQQQILTHFFAHQRSHDSRLSFIPPAQYYQKLIEHGIEKFLVFPYHLIRDLIRFHAAVPFDYYISMLLKVMSAERPYQSIPNFSAADALRVTGVGRNQFIDAMNKYRGSSWSSLLRSKDKVLRALLPATPIPIPLQQWWLAFPVPISPLPKLAQSQRLAYERISAARSTGVPLRQIPDADIRRLYELSLVYFAVPLTPQDTVKVLPLDNFVMNRGSGDYVESLCYKSFISIDDRITVEQLATMLATDVREIEKVLSLFIRLGFAEKVGTFDPMEPESCEAIAKRLALVFDCNLPAALMLGNLGSVVKSHAVTLYEVGKMPDQLVMEFVADLQNVDGEDDDSAVKSHEKCEILVAVITFLKTLAIAAGGVDLLRLESLLDLDDKSRANMFARNYEGVVVLSPLSITCSCLSIPGVLHFGPPTPLFHSPWIILYLHFLAKGGPPVFVWPQGDIVRDLPPVFFEYETARLLKWGADAVVVPTPALLITINDALPRGPVLVQAYEREGEQITDLAFPSKDLRIAGLEQELALGSLFGWLTFVNCEEKWFPVDLLYGIPTVSLALCRHVIEEIQQRDLLGETSCEKMKADTARIGAALQGFVAGWSAGVWHPVRALSAIGGVLHWLKE